MGSRLRHALIAVIASLGAACSSSPGESRGVLGDGGAPASDARVEDGALLDATGDEGLPTDAHSAEGEGTAEGQAACTTRISYGSAWIRPANHPGSFDDAPGEVTWDGACADEGANSYAVLSNGWRPSFQGNGACILALDTQACSGAPASCATRITYGPGWVAPSNHPASYDDVAGRVFSDGVCQPSGGDSVAHLSNGWTPGFSGASSCRLSFRYTQCGGLYANPVIPVDCPDPGVLRDGSGYVLTCTSGDAADAYPIYTSPDLAHWTQVGHVFPSGHWPVWAKRDFWAPEVHKVGSQYVVYFSARGADGMLAIGAASAASALGPFTAASQPLIHDSAMGLIDASEIDAPGGPYVLWKEDGNAVGKPTPIHAQPLAADGLSLLGAPSTLITNDQPWEGAVTEAPFMVASGGSYFLFYSGNSYANATYAVGVARASSPLGPFTKAAAPILTTGGAWVGPGHCAVVDTPAGDTAMVYHAWKQGCVDAAGCGRLDLVDEILWGSGWPSVPLAPSVTSRPSL